MSIQTGILSWSVTELATALKISEEDSVAYFTDGRRVSFIIERRIASEVLRGSLAPSEGAGWDVMNAAGEKWEVRSISKGGIYFCPSYMVGSGRSFDEDGFLEKLENIAGYIISDITLFPEIPFWIIPSEQVKQWWHSGVLGKNSKIIRTKALSLVKELP